MTQPYARDGSTLDESCRHADGFFRIGPKGRQMKIRDLADALATMRHLGLRHWRRPSATSGTPGCVAAVRWA